MELRIILFASLVVSAVSSPVPSKQYRSDYEYNKNTDAFYKLHTEGALIFLASNQCHEEGAKLIKITSDEDLKQVRAMMKKFPDLESSILIAFDVNSDDESEDNDECNIVNRQGELDKGSILEARPFVCKVAAKHAPYDEECGVYSNDYESGISNIGSCYKVSRVKVTWYEAQASCQAEGAHLVVLNNNEELKYLYNMWQEQPHIEQKYHAGVKADQTSGTAVFKTVLNQTLEEVGYGPWEPGEPSVSQDGKNCVHLDFTYSGEYSRELCTVRMQYICEVSKAPLPESETPITTTSGTQMSTVPVPSKQYRSDYEYNKNTDAFYKLHTTKGTRKMLASMKCKEEGAELVKIISDEDVKQIQAMIKKFPDLKDSSVLVSSDVNSVYSRQKNSILESNVMKSNGKIDTEFILFFKLPFVCKVAARDAPYNGECGVYSNGYESRISTTGSCYRVSTVRATWNKAQADCQSEGAHLVILNNDDERNIVFNILKEKSHNFETQYFAGVRAESTAERVFKTVLNQTLEEVGYGPWDENEPNDYKGGENCVALDTRRHGKYNDVGCHVRMPYVCESSGAPLEISATPATPNSVSNAPVSSKNYRPDYEYNKNTDAFYKLHTEGTTKFYASAKCKAEGAELVKITSDEDLKQVLAMTKKLSNQEEYILVAPDDDSNLRCLRGVCNVVNRRGKTKTSCRQKLPFVCKVAASDAQYDTECGVYSNDYESRMSTTGSCYKVSTVEATWNEAHANCQAEGAHLVILNNDEELEVLNNILLKYKRHDSETQYFAGVRADTTIEPRVFVTVLNQTLEEVGYGPWDENEPNDYEGGENCVALDTRRHGKYNDVWCHVRMPYVCESSGAPLEISATPSAPNRVSAVPVPSKHNRAYYEYNTNTDAFYKLHTDGTLKSFASRICSKEGAELVKITSDEDLKQVYAMMKKLSDLEDLVMIASDVNIDSPYEGNVVNRRGKIAKTTSLQQLPFVCKMAAKDAPYSEECGVYSNDYESKISTTGSCYRVSTVEATWDEAQADCQAEGAHLVILSSDEEQVFLFNMLQKKPHIYFDTQYFAGVKADTSTEPRIFKTVFNQTLEEVGYGPWEELEPNDDKGGQNCVALDTRRHGKYNDVWCHVRMPYVCESSGALAFRPPPITLDTGIQIPQKQYRPDYEYNGIADAFYKLHTKGTMKSFARARCIEEGAELLKITSDEDLKQVHVMMEKFPGLQYPVFIELKETSEQLNSSYKTYKSIVLKHNDELDVASAYQLPPFVCKVAAKDAPYNKECDVYSNDYESRISTTGSCYRVFTKAKATWNEAQANCQADGAHLVILNNDKELEVIYNMLKHKPHYSETQYFAGVTADRTSEPRVFKTVMNQTLEEVGYGPWEENEPNGYEGGQNCVALDTRRHGKYNDVGCHVRMPYVCERTLKTPMEIKPSSKSPDSEKMQSGFAVSASIMQTLSLFFGTFSP